MIIIGGENHTDCTRLSLEVLEIRSSSENFLYFKNYQKIELSENSVPKCVLEALASNSVQVNISKSYGSSRPGSLAFELTTMQEK